MLIVSCNWCEFVPDEDDPEAATVKLCGPAGASSVPEPPSKLIRVRSVIAEDLVTQHYLPEVPVSSIFNPSIRRASKSQFSRAQIVLILAKLRKGLLQESNKFQSPEATRILTPSSTSYLPFCCASCAFILSYSSGSWLSVQKTSPHSSWGSCAVVHVRAADFHGFASTTGSSMVIW